MVTISLLLAVSNNPLTPFAACVAFKAMPTASARNWMQASVPAVGQDVTGVRLFDRLLELPVMSEFGAPVSDEVRPAQASKPAALPALHGILGY